MSVSPDLVGLCFFASELCVALVKRAHGSNVRRADRGSLRIVWVAIASGVFAARIVPSWVHSGGFALGATGQLAALVLLVLGLALRWWAILTLGRFFTVAVAIHGDHELVTRGPFRWLRHPSYTGVLLAFLAWGVLYANLWSIACLCAPISAALLYRIHVEEAALSAHFGERWRAYAARSKRLIPGVY